MFSVNTKEIRQYEADLKAFANKAYPFATRNTVNSAAFNAQREARSGVSDSLTLRNRFTVQSIQVEQSRTLRVSRQSSTVGSTADYMEDQEFGVTKSKSGKNGVPITTSYAAGQEGKQPRTRLARRPNALANIQLQNRRKRGRSRKQRNLVAVRTAASSSQKYVFLDLGRRKGIFKVIGGKRNPRVKMVHDLSKQSIRIPKNPWLSPAVKKTEVLIPVIYVKSLEFQLKRNNLFS